MTTCAACGRESADDGRFCAGCGGMVAGDIINTAARIQSAATVGATAYVARAERLLQASA